MLWNSRYIVAGEACCSLRRFRPDSEANDSSGLLSAKRSETLNRHQPDSNTGRGSGCLISRCRTRGLRPAFQILTGFRAIEREGMLTR